MKSALLKHLREDAQNWWYHAQLRKQGNKQMALVRERQTICDNVKSIKKVLTCKDAYITIGNCGVTIHYSDEKSEVRHSGYSLSHVTIAMPLIAMGVTVIDLRDVSIDKIFAMPMVATNGKYETPPNGTKNVSWYRLSLTSVVRWCHDNNVRVINPKPRTVPVE